MINLPSLKAMRAFEVASRLKSLTAAARELNVTRPAVSKQIRLLEQDIGQQLFLRSRKGLELTPAGQTLFASLHHAFELMSSACEQARQTNQLKALKIVADRDFATSWLSSNLHKFFSLHRDVSINLLAEFNEIASTATDCDLKIYYAPANKLSASNPSKLEDLFHWYDLPLCSPAYDAYSDGANNQGVDWSKATLLHDRQKDLWQRWFAAASLAKPDGVIENYFNETSYGLAAASAGAGVAIGDTFTANRHLIEGRLICPVPIAVKSEEAYILEVTESGSNKAEVVSLFRDWLRQCVTDLDASTQKIIGDLQIVTIG